MSNLLIGWSEWCSLPEYDIPLIKAKIDTGAKTSSLHAFDVKEYEKNGKSFINFSVHPVQNNIKIVKNCTSLIHDRRVVTNSGGQKELRYFIKTNLLIGGIEFEIDLNVTNRDSMTFRMLIGRSALRNKFIIDSSKKYLLGRNSIKALNKLYNIQF